PRTRTDVVSGAGTVSQSVRRAALCLAALLASSCGTFGAHPLADAADSLDEIRSGVLGFRLIAETAGGQEAGFFLRGPFSLPDDGSLPLADLSYGQIGTDVQAGYGFVSTGDAAFIEIAGEAYELPSDRVAALFGAAEPADEGVFDELHLEEWVEDPEVSEGPVLDGEPTEEIEGDLHVVVALNDMLDATGGVGGSDIPPVEGEDAERLEAAVESARLLVVTDSDGTFRRLEITVDLEADAPAALQEPLKDLLGVGFKVQMSIDRPNGEVSVEAPLAPRPFEDLVPPG
ncbi:MAG: hypothetical protein M3273_05855, partial [Actinomycetota bacterium]|nr:hypothetical protein [Actinomycetota bacterium]